jgi:hypothetical protein
MTLRTHLLETAFLYQDLLIPWPPEKQNRKFDQISYLEGIYFSSANLVALDTTIE